MHVNILENIQVNISAAAESSIIFWMHVNIQEKR
jgi:hypothetical protein